MNDKLYDMMDWARIEGLVYSEENHPHDFLGAHQTKDGVLIQSFIPSAVSVEVLIEGTKTRYPMEEEDEAGFFAVLIPQKTIPSYRLKVSYDDGSEVDMDDPYSFEPQITQEQAHQFNAGVCWDVYQLLGAHPMTVNGIAGVHFAVWAPNAVRVSVVGDFNLWDGRRLPMRRLWDSGIYELFVPGLEVGCLYKYEIKAKGGLTFLKADPYAAAAELRPNTASLVADLSSFTWSDQAWMTKRAEFDLKSAPINVYEVHLSSWRRPADGRLFYNYRELAPLLADYVKNMGYTHIELLPIMEHPLDESCGYQITGYYAPTARFGSPMDFMFFMNYMHEQEIGVILDWAPGSFPRDTFGLSAFDGTCLYEHRDPRQGTNPHAGTLIYNYGRPEVRNFLIANALYWEKAFHADGIRVSGVSAILYLDYDKRAGEWISNIYGGNENLEAIDFLKQLTDEFHRQTKGAFLIAEESSAWPLVTGQTRDGGLGFDLKQNAGWGKDFFSYMQLDPVFRSYHHGDLTFSMVYNYSEQFSLAVTHEEVSNGKGSLTAKMPGRKSAKLANLRAALGYMYMHPGKKLLFMGQEAGPYKEWHASGEVDWSLLEEEPHAKMVFYVRSLNELYKENPALYAQDFDPNGFEWINSISANENMLVFLRKTDKPDETLLIVCNFSPLVYADHKIGVPFEGKYKEIFNSDRDEFGGAGNLNLRAKTAKKDECDDRPYSIRITVPPMGISVFRCTRVQADASDKTKSESKSGKKVKTEQPKTVNAKDSIEAKAGAAIETAKKEKTGKKS